MQVIKITSINFNQSVKNAILVLKRGGVIAYPTETAYGLGADFLNPVAVRKVYQIKGRDYKKPLSVIVSSLAMAKRFVKFNRLSLALVKKYWPGPLTLILNFQLSILNEFKIDNYKTLGLRISSNKLATLIVKKFGRPITATSANISGKGECFLAKEVVNQFKNRKYQPDLIIDAGKLPKKRMSTIVRITNNQIEVLRQGSVKIPSSKSQDTNKS